MANNNQIVLPDIVRDIFPRDFPWPETAAEHIAFKSLFKNKNKYVMYYRDSIESNELDMLKKIIKYCIPKLDNAYDMNIFLNSMSDRTTVEYTIILLTQDEIKLPGIPERMSDNPINGRRYLKVENKLTDDMLDYLLKLGNVNVQINNESNSNGNSNDNSNESNNNESNDNESNNNSLGLRNNQNENVIIEPIYSDTCSICLIKYGDEKKNNNIADDTKVFLKCGHMFHKSCISKWLKENASCSLCRESQRGGKKKLKKSKKLKKTKKVKNNKKKKNNKKSKKRIN